MRRNHLPTAPPPITITNHNHCHSTRGFAAQHGAEVNNYGGIKAYNITKKLQVAEKYIQAKSKGVIRPIAQECQVSCAFVSKIEGEMLNNEQRILTPEEIRDASDKPSLPGSKKLSDLDRFILYLLLEEKPYRLLHNIRRGCFTLPVLK